MKEFFTDTSISSTETELSFNATDIIDYPDGSVLFFSRKSVLDLRRQAASAPVTPLIVQKIIQNAKNIRQNINIDKERLYKVASEILIKGEGKVTLSNQNSKLSEDINPDNYRADTLSGNISLHGADLSINRSSLTEYSDNTLSTQTMPLCLVKYNHPMEEMEQLVAELIAKGKIPVLWSKARGLVLNRLSKNYPLFNDVNTSDTSDPKEVIRFIIKRPQERIAYILEDFHHYIGEKDVVNPGVGEIRSLIKELSRTLENREDEVYLFVPASYDMPPELALFFARSPKQPRKVEGYLERYGQLLTDVRYLKNAKPLVGAGATIERVIQVLTQMEINNPLLVGYPGVGKTAVVEGLAMAIARGDASNNNSSAANGKWSFFNGGKGNISESAISDRLKGKKLYSLSLNSLVAGTKYRGDLEIRLQGLMDEVLSQKDKIIVFIDEIHTLLDAGSTEGSISAGEFLKPLLARGEFPCIGATTFEGAQSLSKDTAFTRRFKKIIIHEPETDEVIEILRGIAPNFERHHGVLIDDGALIEAVKLSGTYLQGEYLPGKAISLIDGASAYCNMRDKMRLTKEDIKMEISRLKTT